jgi:hypothetical protein
MDAVPRSKVFVATTHAVLTPTTRMLAQDARPFLPMKAHVLPSITAHAHRLLNAAPSLATGTPTNLHVPTVTRTAAAVPQRPIVPKPPTIIILPLAVLRQPIAEAASEEAVVAVAASAAEVVVLVEEVAVVEAVEAVADAKAPQPPKGEG